MKPLILVGTNENVLVIPPAGMAEIKGARQLNLLDYHLFGRGRQDIPNLAMVVLSCPMRAANESPRAHVADWHSTRAIRMSHKLRQEGYIGGIMLAIPITACSKKGFPDKLPDELNKLVQELKLIIILEDNTQIKEKLKFFFDPKLKEITA